MNEEEMVTYSDWRIRKRKIIQISAVPTDAVHTVHLYALCDDGTTWMLLEDVNEQQAAEWECLPPIPQDQ